MRNARVTCRVLGLTALVVLDGCAAPLRPWDVPDPAVCSACTDAALDAGLEVPSPDAADAWSSSDASDAAQEPGHDAGQDAGRDLLRVPCPSDGGCVVARVPLAPDDSSSFVHDGKRAMLYVTSSTDAAGVVRRWDLRTERFVEPLLLGGAFAGADLSPNSELLVVGDRRREGNSHRVHIVDLGSGVARELKYLDAIRQDGNASPIFADDLTVIATDIGTYDQLLEVDLDGGVTVRNELPSGALRASADRSLLVSVSRYPTGQVTVISPHATPRFSSEQFTVAAGAPWTSCVSPDGAQFTLVGPEVHVYRAPTEAILQIDPLATAKALDCVYSPVSDTLYVSWWSNGSEHASLEAYDTNTWAMKSAIEPTREAFAATLGKLAVSRDGRLLFARTADAIAIYRLDGEN